MTRCLVLFTLAFAFASSLQASIAVATRGANGQTFYSVSVQRERVDRVAAKVSALTHQPIVVDDRAGALITFDVTDASDRVLINAVAEAAGLHVVRTAKGVRLQQKEATVTLDVKDGEVRDILRSMKEQCGIRNLMIDPDVQGSGTFLFNDVPCSDAFAVVTRSLGLSAEMSGNVAHVAPRK